MSAGSRSKSVFCRWCSGSLTIEAASYPIHEQVTQCFSCSLDLRAVGKRSRSWLRFPTHYSHSYNSKEALDVTIISPHLSPACNWKILENIGSDHLSILFELNKRQTTYKISNRRWNFKRANWQAYTDRAEKLIAGTEKVIPSDCKIGMFADDIVLWSSSSDIEKVDESVNLALADMWSFAVIDKLSFSQSWNSHQTFRRGSPFGHVVSGYPVASFMEHHSLPQSIEPSEGLDGVYFHVDLYPR
ncbi:RNA-directed DNA polymerase from mobile element jockey [Trichonephila clavipes]|nr:RNA-directed DNA polymerase from mobile element jockey [Trichonephila clavipes]